MSALESYPRVTPFLWFDGNAEEAVEFYLTVFPNSRRLDRVRNDQAEPTPVEPKPKEKVLTLGFELDGQKFTALNGGPMFRFNEAVSFVVRCDTQEDVDYYWTKLADGGSEGQCCWLKDKFGLSWQIVPAKMADYICSPKAMQALMSMKKPEIAVLETAAKG